MIEPKMTSFKGLPKDFFAFFRELAATNEKAWFEENKPRYRESVLMPLCTFMEAMAPRVGRISKHVVVDPRPNGGSMFRIYRDVRFSKDKSPYKTHAALWVFHRDAGRGVGRDAHGGAGFYFHIEPGASLVAAGFWMPPRPLLNVLRERIVDEQRAFERIVKAPAFVKRFTGLSDDEAGVRLTRVPRGWPQDHPAGHWLRFNSFTASRPLTDTEVLSPKLVDAIMQDYALLLPLVRWLNGTLGFPSAKSR